MKPRPFPVTLLLAVAISFTVITGCGERPFVGNWRFDRDQSLPFLVERFIAEHEASRGGDLDQEATELANAITRPILERLASDAVEQMDSTLRINADATFELEAHVGNMPPILGIWSAQDGKAFFTFTIRGVAATATADVHKDTLTYTLDAPGNDDDGLAMVFVRVKE